MHTYQVDNYGIFISISQLKQATYDDLKTLEENGKVMIFERDDIEDIEIYPLTDIGSIDWHTPPNKDSNTVVFIANNRSSLYSPAYAKPSDLIKEIKDAYGKYFPDNYDFEANIVWGNTGPSSLIKKLATIVTQITKTYQP